MRVTHKKKPMKTTYKMDGIPLKEVDSYLYLGVEISKDLNWASHINKISNKANKMLGLLRRNNCSAEVKAIAYIYLCALDWNIAAQSGILITEPI